MEKANSNLHHATAAAWAEFINVQEVCIILCSHNVYIYLYYVIVMVRISSKYLSISVGIPQPGTWRMVGKV